MAEVITDERMRNFVHSKVSNEFGLTVAQVADKCKSYGRFSSWLNGNVTLITEVLNKVKSNGVSPAFFASYEKTEGYNAQWGWLNHTVQQGSYLNDSDSVSKWIVTQSNNTTDQPAWIDFANYNDFVPSAVKSAGNADFNGMPAGSIGKVVIAGTAAATWEVYYPNGLKAEYNGVQNYGAPINAMIDTIESWGGSISGGGTPVDPEEPEEPVDPEPEIPEYDLEGIKNLFNDFYSDLKESIEKMLVADLYSYGTTKTFGNSFLKVNKQLGNMYKIKPTINFNKKIDGIAETMLDKLGGLLIPIEPEEPEVPTDPEPSGEMFFPVDFTAQGINFWVPPDQPNMDYGGERSGRLHWAYDIGTLGNENVSCHAVRSGEVLSVNADGLGTVVIKHDSDSYYTQYMHLVLGAFTVNAGDKVVAGQKIGIVGGTGGYEIHLHFAVSKNGTFATQEDTISPREYLKITGNNVTGLPNPIG